MHYKYFFSIDKIPKSLNETINLFLLKQRIYIRQSYDSTFINKRNFFNREENPAGNSTNQDCQENSSKLVM